MAAAAAGIAPGSWIRGSILGAGSFGTVSLGISRSNGSLFAVKSVELERPQELDALENEISILESISSPHVVQFLGCQRSASSRDAFLEYMPGGSLADLAAKFGGRLEESLLRLYAKGILQGLEFLHQIGIVHCDVKGKNVLVGSQGQVKLADFGSAKRIEARDAVLKGTPLWMAPEVVRHEQQVPASDIWSFGCTVLELLTGKAPWSSSMSGSTQSNVATLLKIACSNEIPELPSGISSSCKSFLERCLCRDPVKRATASELLQHKFIVDDEAAEAAVEEAQKPAPVTPRSPLDFSKFFSSASATSCTSSSSSCSSSMASPKWIVVRSPQGPPKSNAFDCLSDFQTDHSSSSSSNAPTSHDSQESDEEVPSSTEAAAAEKLQQPITGSATLPEKEADQPDHSWSGSCYETIRRTSPYVFSAPASDKLVA